MYEIVVAEDEHWLRSELTEMIERIGGGFTVVGEAVDGEDAWNMLHELWPSILITDIRMPRKDGMELLREVDEAGLPIVSLIISGYDEFAYARQAVRYGVSEYLLKPVMQEELKEALLRSLDRLALFKEMNSCFKVINIFLDRLPEMDANGRSTALENVIQEIWKTQRAFPKSRKSSFSVFESKLTALIQGLDADFMPPESPDWSTKEQTILYFRMLLESWSFKSRAVSGQEVRQVIRKACDYMESHYMQPLTLVKVAGQANLSPSYFGHLFKQFTGQSFISYLNGVRIQKAKSLLMEADIKVYEAAEMVGFISLPHFNRMFKTITGMTPNDYRKGMGF
ncbi:response regulator transcription factor [Paenibacillus mendelii]|uniref:Helix-turn-helix domain-containing protein n=1 Tax=Paenibacillus mendelii TaxID=206163 RepID=A0ABV6J7Q2_9BACL|nr:helix-turn-helix domain-containing protein [Paenibacillus mendelii]MCQ6561434.1 helix-turn-helix domain-containing protein [Paenibacillus mendelii]